MNRDLQIKTLRHEFQEKINGILTTKYVYITEKDAIDLIFKKKGTNTTKRVLGEVIKIGVNNSDNRQYLVIITYEYNDEDNLFKVHLDEITKIINIKHSGEHYSFGPVYSPDESAILLKSVEGALFFSLDGENWNAAVSGSSTEGGKVYKDDGVLDEDSTSDVIPTGKVVYDTIAEMIGKIHPSGGDEFIYKDCQSAGWEGTREELAAALVELCKNLNKIPTVEGASGE